MADIAKLAKEVKARIGSISVPSVTEYIESLNWEVVWYIPGQTNMYLEKLNLTIYASRTFSFKYEASDFRIVFVRENMTEKEKLYLLLHELGHVLLQHQKDTTVEAERQANQFAELCLHQNLSRSHTLRRWLPTTLSFLCLLAMLLSSFAGGCIEFPVCSSTTDGGSTGDISAFGNTGTEDSLDWVVITSTGNKYHRPDCQYVRDRSGAITITLKEALTLRYAPCFVCYPQE